jgi:hypothetical protein
MEKKVLLDVISNGLTITCSNDDMPIQEQTTNYTVPSTYTFERSSNTTVDFSGQSSLLMLEEMGNTIKTAAQTGQK